VAAAYRVATCSPTSATVTFLALCRGSQVLRDQKAEHWARGELRKHAARLGAACVQESSVEGEENRVQRGQEKKAQRKQDWADQAGGSGSLRVWLTSGQRM
jgi:hypothetical protein